MKTKIILVRHGETEWNLLGKFQGCKDIDLSENGIKQAHCLKERIKADFDHIYSSPLIRAFETAKILSEAKGVTPLFVDGLKEVNFGEWEGLTIKDIESKYPEQFKYWIEDKKEAPLCGGDLSIKKASIRATEAIFEIVKRHKGEKVIIVAHGGIIKAGLIGIFNWDMTMYHKIRLGNTSVNIVDFHEDLKPILVTLNDTSHLSGNI